SAIKRRRHFMRLQTVLSFVLTALLAGVFSMPVAAQNEKMDSDPISGEWDVSFYVKTTTTPARFTLKLDGANVTGTAESAHTGPGTVRDGAWKEGKLSFTLDFAKHESIAIKGHLEGDKLVGEFTTEGFTAKWDAKKKSDSKPTATTAAPNGELTAAAINGEWSATFAA